MKYKVVHLYTTSERGGFEIQLHSFLTSSIDGS